MKRNSGTTSIELDPTTVHLLAQLAEMWGVSVNEAIRRAVQQANATPNSSTKECRWEAFKALQRSLDLTPAKAAEWQDAIRDARR